MEEVRADADCTAAADYLAGAVLGLMTLGRSPAPSAKQLGM